MSMSRLMAARRQRTSHLSVDTCSSRGQQWYQGSNDEVADVSRLPDSVASDRVNNDFIKHIMEKKQKNHQDVLEQLDSELKGLSEHCETRVRRASAVLQASLLEVDLRLDTLTETVAHLDIGHQQETLAVWEEVEKLAILKKNRILELKEELSGCETERSVKVRGLLQKYCHLLEKIGFMSLSDIHKLIHAEAMAINQSLLTNRRCVALLLLHLLEENLMKDSLLCLQWDMNRWKRTRADPGYRRVHTGLNQVIVRFKREMRRKPKREVAKAKEKA
ncbi:uncharacterized protein ccdc180 isoform X1 [Thalassophryne amazonica]|uniref:uncharacterized protein ccdc180 isoform X1 n=1 Tax=Thalassophryne amazonica TaxID=390379 RepID=UPI0014712569|nr:uncharacterized protein ccdc180 isoform X1 [Thalassophryne amazonica]